VTRRLERRPAGGKYSVSEIRREFTIRFNDSQTIWFDAGLDRVDKPTFLHFGAYLERGDLAGLDAQLNLNHDLWELAARYLRARHLNFTQIERPILVIWRVSASCGELKAIGRRMGKDSVFAKMREDSHGILA
jgi:hypothetical protein